MPGRLRYLYESTLSPSSSQESSSVQESQGEVKSSILEVKCKGVVDVVVSKLGQCHESNESQLEKHKILKKLPIQVIPKTFAPFVWLLWRS